MSAIAATVERAVGAFRAGTPVLVHDFDDREGETDLLYPADAVEPSDVAHLRNDAGGLVFVALPDDVAAAFDLPFLHEVLSHPATEYEHVGYDARPSFSLSVNHRETYTGIIDDDRARTITALADLADVARRALDAGDTTDRAEEFAAEFRAPGHVHVLRAASDLLAGRQGHTELGLALADAAGAVPAVAGAEMLDDQTGRALSPADARAYAERHGLPFVEGDDLVAAFG